VLIRLAGTHDIDTIADVFVASFAGLTFLPKLHTESDTRRWIRDEMFARHEVWVAEDDGEVVGFAALSGDLLGHLYVRPDAQNRGVGSALLGLVKAERPHGFDLWTFQRNEGARRFYERNGLGAVELTDGAGNEEEEPDMRYEWVGAGSSRS
jgi:GNAT superfamily N-acetyltransferase